MRTDREFKSIRRSTWLSRLYWRLRSIASSIAPWAFAAGQSNSIELFSKDGATSTRSSLRWGDNFIEIHTFDTGEMPATVFGCEDYEFWTRVEKSEFSAVLRALGIDTATSSVEALVERLVAKFRGRSDATSAFEKFCIEWNIPHHSDSWSSGEPTPTGPQKT